MDANKRKRAPTEHNAMDTSVTVTEKRERASVDVAANLGDFLRNQEMRCRVDDLHLVFVAEKEVAKKLTSGGILNWSQGWGPLRAPRWRERMPRSLRGLHRNATAFCARI